MLYRGQTYRYAVQADLLDERVGSVYVPLTLDPATRAWIDDAHEHPNSAMSLVARKIAMKVMSDYDANGLSNTHDMRVLGTEQWRLVLRRLDDRPRGRCLDVGAGDGNVTDELAPLFDEVVTTELSRNMQKRLEEHGYVCHRVDLADDDVPGGPYDVIAMLNVIDRTQRPLTLLERARAHLVPSGLLALAVPLPLSPHVHVGPVTVSPDELLPTVKRSSKGAFEKSANALVRDVFVPLGFRLLSFSRVPYLCRGDARRPVHRLDDAIFVLQREDI